MVVSNERTFHIYAPIDFDFDFLKAYIYAVFLVKAIRYGLRNKPLNGWKWERYKQKNDSRRQTSDKIKDYFFYPTNNQTSISFAKLTKKSA